MYGVASSSRNQIIFPWVGQTWEIGRSLGPWRDDDITCLLLDPVAITKTLRALLTTGSVSETRSLGGLGLLWTGTTQWSESFNCGKPGKSEQMWPSGPTPRNIISKTGYEFWIGRTYNSLEYLKIKRMANVYNSAEFSGVAPEFALWILFCGMQALSKAVFHA